MEEILTILDDIRRRLVRGDDICEAIGDATRSFENKTPKRSTHFGGATCLQPGCNRAIHYNGKKRPLYCWEHMTDHEGRNMK